MTDEYDDVRAARIERATQDTLERVARALRDRYGAPELPVRVRDAIEQGILWAAQASQPVLRPPPRMAIVPPARAQQLTPIRTAQQALRRKAQQTMEIHPWELEWGEEESKTTEFRLDDEETGRYSVRALKKPKR